MEGEQCTRRDDKRSEITRLLSVFRTCAPFKFDEARLRTPTHQRWESLTLGSSLSVLWCDSLLERDLLWSRLSANRKYSFSAPICKQEKPKGVCHSSRINYFEQFLIFPPSSISFDRYKVSLIEIFKDFWKGLIGSRFQIYW